MYDGVMACMKRLKNLQKSIFKFNLLHVSRILWAFISITFPKYSCLSNRSEGGQKDRIHCQHGSEPMTLSITTYHQLLDVAYLYSHAHTFTTVVPDQGKNVKLFMLIAINIFLIKHLHILYQLGKVAEFMLSWFRAQNDNELFIYI